MDFEEQKEIKELISDGLKKIASRNDTIKLRNKSLKPQELRKIAFDTRKFNSETMINPRRGLQNFNRSEAFISEALSNKLKNLKKLKDCLNSLKDTYEKETSWQDSNSRILLSHLDKALRTDIDDGNYSENQKGVGSINYLEELLYVRYRLVLNELDKIHDDELKKIILSKDEDLSNKNFKEDLITTGDVGKLSYDQLLNTLFAGVKATSENKKVKRKITIEVEDEIVD